jgi:hypothetical protein
MKKIIIISLTILLLISFKFFYDMYLMSGGVIEDAKSDVFGINDTIRVDDLKSNE